MSRVSNKRPISIDLALSMGLARVWVRFYTTLLHQEVRETRRRELDSDLWEQQAHGLQSGAPPLVTAGELLARVLLGIPDDVLWRLGAARAESQAARIRDRAGGSPAMNIQLTSLTGRGALLSGALWLLLVGLGALMFLLDIEPDAGEGFMPWLFFGLGLLTMVVFMGGIASLMITLV